MKSIHTVTKVRQGSLREEDVRVQSAPRPAGTRRQVHGRAPPDDDAASSADSVSESFEYDVNTLNRCFDDIERFAARIQVTLFLNLFAI